MPGCLSVTGAARAINKSRDKEQGYCDPLAAAGRLVPGAWMVLRRVGDKAVVVFGELKCESPRSKGVAG